LGYNWIASSSQLLSFSTTSWIISEKFMVGLDKKRCKGNKYSNTVVMDRFNLHFQPAQ